jgi:hypothetical protein
LFLSKVNCGETVMRLLFLFIVFWRNLSTKLHDITCYNSLAEFRVTTARTWIVQASLPENSTRVYKYNNHFVAAAFVWSGVGGVEVKVCEWCSNDRWQSPRGWKVNILSNRLNLYIQQDQNYWYKEKR